MAVTRISILFFMKADFNIFYINVINSLYGIYGQVLWST
jgi:hypothetical protein